MSEDELRIQLMVAQARIVALERELALFQNRTIKAVRREKVLSQSRLALLRMTDGKCFYCNSELSFENFTADHLIPVSKGGRNGIHNLVRRALRVMPKRKIECQISTKLSAQLHYI